MINAPCKDCKSRYLGCHSSCERYKTFREERTRQNQAEQSRRDEDYTFLEIRYRNHKRKSR